MWPPSSKRLNSEITSIRTVGSSYSGILPVEKFGGRGFFFPPPHVTTEIHTAGVYLGTGLRFKQFGEPNYRLVGETRGNKPKGGEFPAARVGNDG